MPEGPALATQVEDAITAARAGDATKISFADQLLSSAWVRYVQAMRAPATGVEYAAPSLAPSAAHAETILLEVLRASSLEEYVQSVSEPNPMYVRLREAAWNQMQSGNSVLDRRVLASLERTRILPASGRYVLVDVRSAQLFMMENAQVQDSMKIVVGKVAPDLQTPMIASTIYYATFNPYWHVPQNLVPGIAKAVLKLGPSALKPSRYQVVDAIVEHPNILDPSAVNWNAVVAGTDKVWLRQLPGPRNSMGALKIPFPNATGVYLHDTPHKEYFNKAQRTLSNGCIRLEDAQRFVRWLLGRDIVTPSEPEQQVQLPKGVPIYITYLTAQVEAETLVLLPDVYGLDIRELTHTRALH